MNPNGPNPVVRGGGVRGATIARGGGPKSEIGVENERHLADDGRDNSDGKAGIGDATKRRKSDKGAVTFMGQ